MAALALQTIVEAGLSVNLSNAAAGGDTADNSDGKTFIMVNNTSGASVDVTITAQVNTQEDPKLGTLTKDDIVKSVAAGAIALIGPLKKQAFNNNNGVVAIGYSASANVKVAALKIQY